MLYYKEGRKTPACGREGNDQQPGQAREGGRGQAGDVKNPLLLSVRSGAKFSMPGMMDTILEPWLNDKTVEGLKARTKTRPVRVRQLPQIHPMFGNVVLEIPKRGVREDHSRRSSTRTRRRHTDTELDESGLPEVVGALQGGRPGENQARLPAGPARTAARRARRGVPLVEKRSRDRIPLESTRSPIDGTAVNVSARVFGNMGDRSATGVGFTGTGPAANEFYGRVPV